MVKTTLYLPDDLKQSVAKLAERHNVSEAEMIRTALRNEVAAELPLPETPLFHSDELGAPEPRSCSVGCHEFLPGLRSPSP